MGLLELIGLIYYFKFYS